MDDPEVTLQEQVFHNAVRELIISLLLFILLYVVSYVTLCQFRRKADNEDTYAGEDDAAVYRISLWLCTGTLSVSVGAVLLLPISIISNEVLLLYPDSYYIKWLNSSLIQGLWNHVFFFSNLALFILMPFAYLFTEAEGFSGSRKGLMGRVYEASVVLFLLGILVLGLFYVASAIISGDEKSKQTLLDAISEMNYGKCVEVWHEHLPYLYSVISFFGVLVLLMCTPVGVARMFTVMGQLIVKPQFLRDIEDKLNILRLEEENLLRKITYRYEAQRKRTARKDRTINTNISSSDHTCPTCGRGFVARIGLYSHLRTHLRGPCQMSNGHSSIGDLMERLQAARTDILALESRQHISFWRRNLCYPVVMLLLLAITIFSILIVLHNTILLLVGTKALPKGASDTVLGISSLSSLGPVGAALQIVVILYLMVASVVGFYSLPYLHKLQPKRADTSMVKIILNCVVILLLSSALPILSKTLGITNFDLVGNFGSMDWLGNFYIIFLYNVLFAVSTALCLFNKFTSAVRHEIYNRLKAAFHTEKKSSQLIGQNHSTNTSGLTNRADHFKEE